MNVLAVGCHPDDIELMMAGTLFLLKKAGATVHYLNVANGCCGTDSEPVDRITARRREEARAAAARLGATWYESMVNDLEVFYEKDLIRRLTAIVREVKPSIVLTQSLEDYMEDHVNTARVTVTAAFCRGMSNWTSLPERPTWAGDLVIYHSTPHMLTDPMRRPIMPEIYVDVGSVIQDKRAMLACHESQKVWLDRSQGMDSYLDSMVETTRTVGALSGRFALAEGWRRHSHVGFSAADGDPLSAALAPSLTVKASATRGA